MPRNFESRDMYTGTMLERDAFGDPKLAQNPAFVEACRRYLKADGHITFRDAERMVREHGKEDPENPKKPFAKDLRLEIIEALGLSEEDEGQLKFYSAVGTPLDTRHGVDAFFRFEPKNGPPIMVALDITKNPNKREGDKEDRVIIREIADPDSEEEQYLAQVERYGALIARAIKDREKRERGLTEARV